MKSNCKKCDDLGWYANHNEPHTHNPETGECMECPVQVICDCKKEGEGNEA